MENFANIFLRCENLYETLSISSTTHAHSKHKAQLKEYFRTKRLICMD